MHSIRLAALAAAFLPLLSAAEPQRPLVALYDAAGVTRKCDTTLDAAQGGQEEEMDMVRKFLGREPRNKAFLEEISGKR